MIITSPTEIDSFVERILKKIGSEYEPELVPIEPEEYAIPLNCFPNVDFKVKNDGGKVHYGWAVYKTGILCEAERHAVWENDDGELIDITPREDGLNQIMFVSDDNFIYTGQLVDNIRVNITKNPVVDDFIFVCEKIEKMYSYGKRIDDNHLEIHAEIGGYIQEFEDLKHLILEYVNVGNNERSKCICGGNKSYKNCHGKTLKDKVKNDLEKVDKLNVKKQSR